MTQHEPEAPVFVIAPSIAEAREFVTSPEAAAKWPTDNKGAVLATYDSPPAMYGYRNPYIFLVGNPPTDSPYWLLWLSNAACREPWFHYATGLLGQ